MEFMPTTRIEINLDHFIHNLRQVKSFLSPGTALCAVVKGDAYGHGAVEMARVAAAFGADYLAVTTLEEGLELRYAGIDTPVLLMGALLPQEMPPAVAHDLTVTVSDYRQIEALAKAAEEQKKKVRVHLKVETGMGRYGVAPGEAADFARAISAHESLLLEGVYTHFAQGDKPSAVKQQLTLFQQALQAIEAEGLHIPLRHAANSAATLTCPQSWFDMVRVGNLLYGQVPAPGINCPLALKETWEMKSRIVAVKNVPKGSGVGYGSEYIAKADTRIGVVPVGYVDGFLVQPQVRSTIKDALRQGLKLLARALNLSRVRVTVSVNGKAVPVIGRVAMQTMMLHLANHPDIQVGDEVIIPMRRTNAASRLARVYFFQGQPVRCRTLLATEDLCPAVDAAYREAAAALGKGKSE